MPENDWSDFEGFAACVDSAVEWNLMAEVAWSAMRYLKENPAMSIGQAMAMGHEDWVK